jgi:rod shape-determining protein MreD
MIRAIAFLLVGYFLLIAVAAADLLLPLHATSPELVLLIVLYLGLGARGSTAGNVAAGLALGYLVDLFSGAPRGLHSLTYGVVMVTALGASSRLLVSSRWQQVVVAGLVSMGHGALLVALSSTMYDGEALQALRILPLTALTTALCAPILFALFRRVDKRLAPDPGALRLRA